MPYFDRDHQPLSSIGTIQPWQLNIQCMHLYLYINTASSKRFSVCLIYNSLVVCTQDVWESDWLVSHIHSSLRWLPVLAPTFAWKGSNGETSAVYVGTFSCFFCLIWTLLSPSDAPAEQIDVRRFFQFVCFWAIKITSLCSDGRTSRPLCVNPPHFAPPSEAHCDDPTVRTRGYDYLWQKQFTDYIWWKTLRVSREGGVYFSRKQTPLKKKRRKERKMKINRAGKRSGNGQSLWHRWEPVWVQVMRDGAELPS